MSANTPARLRTWADARDKRNPDGHGKTGTELLRRAADEIDDLDQAFYAWRQRAYEVCPELLPELSRPRKDGA